MTLSSARIKWFALILESRLFVLMERDISVITTASGTVTMTQVICCGNLERMPRTASFLTVTSRGVSNHQKSTGHSRIYICLFSKEIKHQSSVLVTTLWGIQHCQLDSAHKRPIIRKVCPCQDVNIFTNWFPVSTSDLVEGPREWTR